MAPEASDERDYLRRFGVVLAKMRRAAGLSQAEVADHIGVDSQTLSRWENGRNAPRVVELAKMVRLYEPDPDLLRYLFNPPPVPVHDLDALLDAPERIAGRRRKPPAGGTDAAPPGDEPPPRRRGSAR